MNMRICFGVCLLVLPIAGGAQESARPPILGRWDITIRTPQGDRAAWLEVDLSGSRTLVGRFVGTGGSVRPISEVEFANGEFRFAIPPQWERIDGKLAVTGRLDGDRLSGTMTPGSGPPTEWTAARAPSLRRSGAPQWGTPVTLLNGRDLTGWHPKGTTNAWTVEDGILKNAKAGSDLITDATFTDFKLHAELRYPAHSNSGIYLRGRYEVQIADTPDTEPEPHILGAIYGFLEPSAMVAKKPGEWQTFDITLIGRMVTVALNGTTIICDREIPGITGGALDSREGEPGPLVLQGDHGPIDFRNLVLTPERGHSNGTVKR
jgi:3-keto-disaccharide hydrolase